MPQLSELDHTTSEPKYRQIAQRITEAIESDQLPAGTQLPSITQLSIDYLVSRDTVEKAYQLLRDRGIIESVKGKGFYVLASQPQSKLRIFVLFNKLSSYKKVIYDALAVELAERAHLELFIYHCNLDLFERYIADKVGKYQYYVVMSHFDTPDKARIAKAINQIEPDRLILLDNQVEGVDRYRGLVYQDFKSDIFQGLTAGLEQLRKYRQLICVFPEEVPYPYPKQILAGFQRFCHLNQFAYDVVHQIKPTEPIPTGTAYIVIDENDLTKLIVQIKKQELQIGQDVGIISYNDTPLKEVLLDGITVITTNFEHLGQYAAQFIKGEKAGKIKNDFNLIKRNSL